MQLPYDAKREDREAMRPKLSVVIPTFQLRDRIKVTLRSLETQTLDRDQFELIFVDDGSQDGTAEILESWKPPLFRRVLRNECNRGPSVSRNRGWREAQGEVIVFLDGDMILHPCLLETYHQIFSAQEVDVVSGERRCLQL